MINNKFNILREDLLRELYQDAPTVTTHVPVYLNKNQGELIGNAAEEVGATGGGNFVVVLHDDAAEKISPYEIDYDFDYTILETDDATGKPARIKVNHLYLVQKQSPENA